MNLALFYRTCFPLLIGMLLIGCEKNTSTNARNPQIIAKDSIVGKSDYLNSPFVTAGNRVYMVGHQNGTFPDLGWHILGEMGGVWNHPIKLMDGFSVTLAENDQTFELNDAKQFTNFPFYNRHLFESDDMQISVIREQFVPDDLEGVSVDFQIHNSSDKKRTIAFQIEHRVDLRPTWLSDSLQIQNGKDSAVYHPDYLAWVAHDEKNSWYTVYGITQEPTKTEVKSKEEKGLTTTTLSEYTVDLPPNSTKNLYMVIAGSYLSEKVARRTYKTLHADWKELFEQKQLRYAQLAEQSQLRIPDKQMAQTFRWLKYNGDWLVREVPEIGTGIGAGLPDYPWWFGVDSEYALQGYMMTGQQEIVTETIELLAKLSQERNGNGRIVHEVSTNGVVFNPGNINETPQFASLIWKIYNWNGDRDFLEKYFPMIEAGLDWLLTEKDLNQNLFPDGFGMMEIHGLDSEMIDVAAYSAKAFLDAAEMAKELEKNDLHRKYTDIANRMVAKINQDFWSESFASYADFIGTDAQALRLIEDAIVRADTLQKPWAIAELQQTKAHILANPSPTARPFVLHHNWVVNTPMEVGIADFDKAQKALKTAENFVNPFGVFVTGIDRDESAGSDEGSFQGSKIFGYTGAVMTLPTGVQAIAENNYGNPNRALNYLERMTRSFSFALPGSMYEVSPDYGMMTQAWNIYSFAVPIVEQFFGIRPQAQNKKIVIRPQMPDVWSDVGIQNVRLGASNAVKMDYLRTDKTLSIQIEQNESWEVQIELPQSINGKTLDLRSQGFTLQGRYWTKNYTNNSVINERIAF